MKKAIEALKLWASVAPELLRTERKPETAKIVEIATRMTREALKEAA